MRAAEQLPEGEVARVEDLTVRYGAVDALSEVDLVLPVASTIAVIGPNGSGKSTLLGALAGLVAPVRGRVVVDRGQLALVLQSTTVDPTLPITAVETVRMARYRHRGLLRPLRSTDHAAVADAMARMEVTDLSHRQLHELSGGQRQRVLVAQGLAQQADLLLLDEPDTGLDVVSRELIRAAVSAERAAGRTIVSTTHSLDEAAGCDLVVLLASRVIAFGPPEEVLVPAHLDEAYGSSVVHLPNGPAFLDDPHHHDHLHHPGHHHGHHHAS